MKMNQSTLNYPIYPSLLAFDFTRLGEQVVALDAAGAAGFHFDLMDGQFVSNLTFGPLLPAALRDLTVKPFSAHLMVKTPEALILALATAGVNRLYLHPESTPHIHRALSSVRDAGMEAAVALNPGTPLQVLEPLLPLLHGVLIMSVNPGFGGQAFIPETLARIAQVHALLRQQEVTATIECDGGVDLENIAELARTGMTGAVVGTALFRDGDPTAALAQLAAAVR